MIFHAMSSLPDRWNFLIGHKPDSKESEMTLAVAQNVAKSHRKRYKSQELNNANSDKLRSSKSVKNWVGYRLIAQVQGAGAREWRVSYMNILLCNNVNPSYT